MAAGPSASAGLVGSAIHRSFFFNDTATTEIYTLSLHDALPISGRATCASGPAAAGCARRGRRRGSEEHPSELQSHLNLVCRLLLEKKKNAGTTRARRHGADRGPARRRASRG